MFFIWDFVSTPKGENRILSKATVDDSSEENNSKDPYLEEAQEEVENILKDNV